MVNPAQRRQIPGIPALAKDVPRIMKREWQKLAWYLPRYRAAGFLFYSRIQNHRAGAVVLFSALMLA